MSTGKKSRVPIPLPHNVQGDQPPTVPFHSGSAEVPPPPPTRYHRPGKSASTEESLGETAQIAPRNVYFEPQVEYDDIVTSQNQPGEVAIELGEIAAGDPSSEHSFEDTFSGRSDISHAPSVEHFNISFEFKKTFREHTGARVMKSYHRVLKHVYNQTLSWSYNIFLFAFGLLLAILWALIITFVAILQTWLISPGTRISLVIVRGLLPLVLEPLGLFFKSFASACGCRAGGLGGLMSSFGNSGLQRQQFIA